MKKFFLFLVVLITLSFSLFAGGAGQQQQSSGSQTVSPGKVEIRASYWGDAKRFELYDAIIKEFEKVHTNISVIREPISWNDYWDKLTVQIAGGNASDFLCMHPQYAADYIPRGVMEPLDKYVADGTISLDGWAQGTIDTGKYNGILYMLAMGVTYNGAIVNTGVFKELNIAPPEFAWSWDDAKRIGLQVRAAFDAKGIKDSWMLADISTNIMNFRYYNRTFGREVYDEKGNINCTQEDVERWFTMFKEFRDLGIIPDGATSTEFARTTLEDSLFARDRALIVWNPANQYWQYCTTFPTKEVALIRMAGSKGQPYPTEWPQGAHYGVYSGTTNEKKLAAAQLVNFWLNDERSLVIYKFDQGVPANTPVVNRVVVPLLDEPSKVYFNFVNTLSTIATPTIQPPSGASEIDSLFLNVGEQVAYNNITPATAAKEFYEQVVAIRAKASR